MTSKDKDIVVKTDLTFEEAMKALVRADKGKVDKALWRKSNTRLRRGLKSQKPKQKSSQSILGNSKPLSKKYFISFCS